MTKPVRIQRRRTKGWKMPANTVSVTRPGKWGNPFFIINEEGVPWVSDARDPNTPVLNGDVAELLGLGEANLTWDAARKGVVALFRARCIDGLPNLASLRGKNLACWCPHVDVFGKKFHCHADVLLEIANA